MEASPLNVPLCYHAQEYTNIQAQAKQNKRNENLKRSLGTRQMKLDEDSLFMRMEWPGELKFLNNWFRKAGVVSGTDEATRK